MSIGSLTHQNRVFKRYHSDTHNILKKFYLQDGGKNQLA